jgi:hypothetical protein
MIDTGANMWGGSMAQSGMHSSVGVARCSVCWARGTELHGGVRGHDGPSCARACGVVQVGVRGCVRRCWLDGSFGWIIGSRWWTLNPSPKVMNNVAKYIYMYVCYSSLSPSPGLGDQASDRVNRPGDLGLCAHIGRPPHVPAHRTSLTEPIDSARPDRADTAPIESIDSARTRPHVTLPFFDVAQLFYYIVSPFAAMNSTILFHWTQSFCCNELSHFTSSNSAIFCYIAHSFCDFATMNSIILLSYFIILSAILLH